MTAILFILKRRGFHPPPEDCRHSGNVIYEGYAMMTIPEPPDPEGAAGA